MSAPGKRRRVAEVAATLQATLRCVQATKLLSFCAKTQIETSTYL